MFLTLIIFIFLNLIIVLHDYSKCYYVFTNPDYFYISDELLQLETKGCYACNNSPGFKPYYLGKFSLKKKRFLLLHFQKFLLKN